MVADRANVKPIGVLLGCGLSGCAANVWSVSGCAVDVWSLPGCAASVWSVWVCCWCVVCLGVLWVCCLFPFRCAGRVLSPSREFGKMDLVLN